MAARKKAPAVEQERKEMPSTQSKAKELPVVGAPENIVMIGGAPIEIKPTKLKYQRNRTALFYNVLDNYPLPEIVAMEKGTFGDERDGDKCVFDFLVAATDNPELILANYDEMTTETIETILKIYRRVNKIDEKEQKLKNQMTPGKTKA